MIRTVFSILFLLISSGAAPEPFKMEYVKYISVYEAIGLVQEFRPDWYLSPKCKGEGREKYFRDGERHPKGLTIAEFTLLLAPFPTNKPSSLNPEFNWNICLVGDEKVVNWETKTEDKLRFALSKNGSVALVERIGTHVVILNVLNKLGESVFSDVWLSKAQQRGRVGCVSRDPGVLAFSPTDQWLVMSTLTPFKKGSNQEELVRIFDCFSGEEWEIMLEACDIIEARFTSNETVQFNCTSYSKDGTGRITRMGEKRESRSLNLRTRMVD